MGVTSIEIKDKEILRYLGYKNQELTEDIVSLIRECKELVKNNITPRYVYNYNAVFIKENRVHIEGANLILKGKSIANHLKECEACVFIATTLGNGIEKLIRLYEKKDLTKAVIIDACATAAVEEFCDNIEKSIEEAMTKAGKNITFRFSPGYGDLPISVQKDFLSVLDCERQIGLTCSDHDILIPRKSVTAIIGISNKPIPRKVRSCYGCSSYKHCSFRREGNKCGSNVI